MLHLRYWKYSYQFTLCSSDQHKFNKNKKSSLGKFKKTWKEPSLTLTDTLIQKRYKCKLTAPFALLPPAFPRNPNPFLPEVGQFHTGSVKTDYGPESDGPILLLTLPLRFGSIPPLNWITWNMNSTLRYDDKATQTIPHSEILIRIIQATLGSLDHSLY